MKEHLFHIMITILYILFTYMIVQGINIHSGHVQIYELYSNQAFKILRVTFFILALSMSFICLIKFFYQVNKRNFIRLMITGFPILVAVIYIIYGSIVIYLSDMS